MQKKDTRLSVVLTSVQLKCAELVPILFSDCCAARRLFHCKIMNNVSKIILRCLGSMCTAWCTVLHEHKITRLNRRESDNTKMGRNRWPNNIEYYIVFAVEKASNSSGKAGGGQFSTASVTVKLVSMLLIIDYILCGFSAFWHVALFCLVSWSKYEISTWIFVCVSMNVCSLKCMFSLIYFSLIVVWFSAKVWDVFMGHPILYFALPVGNKPH